MSKIQGFFPLFLATAFGVANGLWVFGPAFKEQNENEAFPKDQLVASKEVDTAHVEELRTIEAAVSRASATQSAVKAVEKPTSWWTSMGGWGSRTVNGTTNTKEAGNASAPTKSSTEDKTSTLQTSVLTSQPLSTRSENDSKDSKDSVIGGLAERARKDPGLKVLMEAVASGKASTDQLKKFQTHLDELKRR